MTTEQNLKIAFVGAGRMGREHLLAFRGLPGVSLAGITSRTRARAEALAAEFGVERVYDSIDEMRAGTAADIVVVAVPELEANPVLKMCFAHPWLVFAEKPVGLDLADALDIQEAARVARARVLVGLNRRFMSSTMAARADLQADPAPRYIHVQDQQDFATGLAIGYPQAVVANWMYGNSIHVIDYLCVFGRGEVTRVTEIEPWRPEAPGLVLTRVDFASGDIGLYQALWHAPGPWACTVVTPRRRWEMRPLEKAVFQNGGERALNPVDVAAEDAEFKPGFRRQAQGVVAAARGLAHEVADLDEATRTMRLIAALYAAGPGKL